MYGVLISAFSTLIITILLYDFAVSFMEGSLSAGMMVGTVGILGDGSSDDEDLADNVRPL